MENAIQKTIFLLRHFSQYADRSQFLELLVEEPSIVHLPLLEEEEARTAA